MEKDAFNGGEGPRNLMRRLKRHKACERKRTNAEKQDSSVSGTFPKGDEGNGLQVSTSSSHAPLSSSLLFSGAMAEFSEDVRLDSVDFFISPGDSLLVDPLTGQTLRPSSGAEAVDNFSGTGNWNLHERLLSTYPTSLSISPPLSRDATALDLTRLLRCVQDFSDSRLRSPYKDLKPIPSLEKLWLNVHNCIYLYKVNDIARAEPLLKQLCLVPSEVMLNLSIDSVSQLLAAFAPVNFRRHPEVRTKLLGQFTKMAAEALGHDNTITVICKELQKDEDSRYSTEMALRCMLGSMHLARCPSMSGTERAIIALLRRDKAFDDALRMAHNLVRSSNANARPKSEEIRDAAKELAHVYMDMGRFKEAKALCMTRVGEIVARDGLIGHEYRDSRTMSALEDLAMIEEELGRSDLSATWLQHAAELAKLIKGRSIALTHILDKLARALWSCDRYDDAEVLMRSYTPYVWSQDLDVTRQ